MRQQAVAVGSNSEGFQPSLPPPTLRPRGDLGAFMEQSDLASYFMHEKPGSGVGGEVCKTIQASGSSASENEGPDSPPPPPATPHTRALKYAATDRVVHPP